MLHFGNITKRQVPSIISTASRSLSREKIPLKNGDIKLVMSREYSIGPSPSKKAKKAISVKRLTPSHQQLGRNRKTSDSKSGSTLQTKVQKSVITDACLSTDDHTEASVEIVLRLPYLKSFQSREALSDLPRYDIKGSKPNLGKGKQKPVREALRLDKQPPEMKVKGLAVSKEPQTLPENSVLSEHGNQNNSTTNNNFPPHQFYSQHQSQLRTPQQTGLNKASLKHRRHTKSRQIKPPQITDAFEQLQLADRSGRSLSPHRLEPPHHAKKQSPSTPNLRFFAHKAQEREDPEDDQRYFMLSESEIKSIKFTSNANSRKFQFSSLKNQVLFTPANTGRKLKFKKKN